MLAVSHHEAILFRLLVAFFGEDRVIPHMSAAAACGGEVPSAVPGSLAQEIERTSKKSVAEWARGVKCLFTIVNHENEPRLVIEFSSDFGEVVDLDHLDRHRFLKPLLAAAGVPYVSMTEEELSDITDPGTRSSLFTFLESRLEIEEGESS